MCDYRFSNSQMYKLFNNCSVLFIDIVIDVLILSLPENARNGLFCPKLSLRENGGKQPVRVRPQSVRAEPWNY